ncbi:type II toxin-antitoxin system PemK/MazF family toxin [Enterococcus sp. CSURQ0835]|uniref:type II toxin-antitoxin system PemK/MazF family toxin n=1 Tax=Enterococcus sp. CSURQ0835 TaxID=2681394 RepID=UPI003FA58F01
MDDPFSNVNEGDIVWIDFDSSAGKEIQKRIPGLVVSRYEFNRSTMFAVVCPITSTIKKLPTRYSLPTELETSGQVLISQLRSLSIFFDAKKQLHKHHCTVRITIICMCNYKSIIYNHNVFM